MRLYKTVVLISIGVPAVFLVGCGSGEASSEETKQVGTSGKKTSGGSRKKGKSSSGKPSPKKPSEDVSSGAGSKLSVGVAKESRKNGELSPKKPSGDASSIAGSKLVVSGGVKGAGSKTSKPVEPAEWKSQLEAIRQEADGRIKDLVQKLAEHSDLNTIALEKRMNEIKVPAVISMEKIAGKDKTALKEAGAMQARLEEKIKELIGQVSEFREAKARFKSAIVGFASKGDHQKIYTEAKSSLGTFVENKGQKLHEKLVGMARNLSAKLDEEYNKASAVKGEAAFEIAGLKALLDKEVARGISEITEMKNNGIVLISSGGIDPADIIGAMDTEVKNVLSNLEKIKNLFIKKNAGISRENAQLVETTLIVANSDFAAAFKEAIAAVRDHSKTQGGKVQEINDRKIQAMGKLTAIAEATPVVSRQDAEKRLSEVVDLLQISAATIASLVEDNSSDNAIKAEMEKAKSEVKAHTDSLEQNLRKAINFFDVEDNFNNEISKYVNGLSTITDEADPALAEIEKKTAEARGLIVSQWTEKDGTWLEKQANMAVSKIDEMAKLATVRVEAMFAGASAMSLQMKKMQVDEVRNKLKDLSYKLAKAKLYPAVKDIPSDEVVLRNTYTSAANEICQQEAAFISEQDRKILMEKMEQDADKIVAEYRKDVQYLNSPDGRQRIVSLLWSDDFKYISPSQSK